MNVGSRAGSGLGVLEGCLETDCAVGETRGGSEKAGLLSIKETPLAGIEGVERCLEQEGSAPSTPNRSFNMSLTPQSSVSEPNFSCLKKSLGALEISKDKLVEEELGVPLTSKGLRQANKFKKKRKGKNCKTKRSKRIYHNGDFRDAQTEKMQASKSQRSRRVFRELKNHKNLVKTPRGEKSPKLRVEKDKLDSKGIVPLIDNKKRRRRVKKPKKRTLMTDIEEMKSIVTNVIFGDSTTPLSDRGGRAQHQKCKKVAKRQDISKSRSISTLRKSLSIKAQMDALIASDKVAEPNSEQLKRKKSKNRLKKSKMSLKSEFDDKWGNMLHNNAFSLSKGYLSQRRLSPVPTNDSKFHKARETILNQKVDCKGLQALRRAKESKDDQFLMIEGTKIYFNDRTVPGIIDRFVNKSKNKKTTRSKIQA